MTSLTSVEEMCGYTTRVREEGRLRADRANTSVRPVGICEGGGGELAKVKERGLGRDVWGFWLARHDAMHG
jgi:hypothetical protein